MNRVGKIKLAPFVRPREKAARMGLTALTDSELVQLVVGSGVSNFTVAQIARRVSRLLKTYGAEINSFQLSSIPGLGPARSAQLSAVFELARRFPSKHKESGLLTVVSVLDAIRSQAGTTAHLWVLTLDGARRLIERRSYGEIDSIAGLLREVSVGIVKDNATHVVFARPVPNGALLPEMEDLSIAKEAKQLGRLLGLGTIQYLIYDETNHYAVMKDLVQ